MKNLGFGYLLIVLMVMCQENFAGDCVFKPNNCLFEDWGFFCCIPEAEAYKAVSGPYPTVVAAVPAASCAPAFEYNFMTHQCDIPQDIRCGGMSIDQGCDS